MEVSKLIKFLEDKKYNYALVEAKRLMMTNGESPQLVLVAIYCYWQLHKNKALYHFLQDLSATYDKNTLIVAAKKVKDMDENSQFKLDLEQFIHSYISFSNSAIAQMPEEQFNQLMYQLTVKPTIK
jgi:arabinogalactan endo-1,4-beta-galactosidase